MLMGEEWPEDGAGSVKPGEKLVDAALHHFAPRVVTARSGRDAIAVALERTAHGSAVAVAHTELNRHFTRGENVAGHVEVQKMGVAILHGAGYGRGAVVGPETCHGNLAAFGLRGEQPFRVPAWRNLHRVYAGCRNRG